LQWYNTSGPLDIEDLKGKFVLLDFWTYCCINCMHILPALKKLEHAYPGELVVIGVHSAKFENEKDSQAIREAILRYEIEHPVVNDADHAIWDRYAVSSWPSLRVIDPEGYLVAGHSGEIEFDTLDQFLKQVIPYYKKKGTLDNTPLHFHQESAGLKGTPLRYPGKVLADEVFGRLFIADSNHNRLVIATLEGKLIDVIGTGVLGKQDGAYDAATFNHPQGMALRGQTLYVADTENHLLRKIDLAAKTVTTIAGTGAQARGLWPGIDELTFRLPERFVGPPLKTPLNSPWDLWIHGDDLYIAMAGPHQIWKMPLDELEIGPYAGNGREDIVDGPLLPRQPYEMGYSSFAQPSGLASDGSWLYVADSEGSSIRAVPFDLAKEVRTLVGTSLLPSGRLFTFGDRDGTGLLELKDGNPLRDLAAATAGPLLQHCLGVVFVDGRLYVADTYNNKIKVLDLQTADLKTLAGDGTAGASDDPPRFHEPAGISAAAGKLYVADTNNHLIRSIDLKDGNHVRTLSIAGLAPPAPPKEERRPKFPGAKEVELEEAVLSPSGGAIKLRVDLQLPQGWKLNPDAPLEYLLEVVGDAGPFKSDGPGQLVRLPEPATPFEVSVPVARNDGQGVVRLSLTCYYCQESGLGVCKVGSVIWRLPIQLEANAPHTSVVLRHALP
jgi:thiol-disulfide isomerase/thioredoxin